MLAQIDLNSLNQLLSLYRSSSQISLANLSEIILFTCGINPVLRFVVTSEFAIEIQNTLNDADLYFYSGNLYLSRKENGWTSISNKPINKNNDHEIETLLVMGYEESFVKDCYKNELNGEFHKSGKYFNYPECCITAYPVICSSEQNWANTILELSGDGPYPCWSNRLATGWGGTCFTGELFPCNLHCEYANEIGKLTYSNLNKLGLKRLAEEFLQQSLSSVIVHKNGKIERSEHSSYQNGNLIQFKL